ncbi:MAG TPA: ABC transporter, partial [Thermoanaerobaculia bacterium]
MSTTSDYGIRKTVALGFDDAVARTRDLLQAEGFGVLTEIDMQAKLKEKIGA